MTSSPRISLNNGVQLPALGLGVFQSPPAETVVAVEAAIASGYRLLDTAAAYGNEREVGEGIRRSRIDRDDIFLTTKLWISDYGYEQALIGSTAACADSASITSTSSCSTIPSRATSTVRSARTQRSSRCWPTVVLARSASRTSAKAISKP